MVRGLSRAIDEQQAGIAMDAITAARRSAAEAEKTLAKAVVREEEARATVVRITEEARVTVARAQEETRVAKAEAMAVSGQAAEAIQQSVVWQGSQTAIMNARESAVVRAEAEVHQESLARSAEAVRLKQYLEQSAAAEKADRAAAEKRMVKATQMLMRETSAAKEAQDRAMEAARAIKQAEAVEAQMRAVQELETETTSAAVRAEQEARNEQLTDDVNKLQAEVKKLEAEEEARTAWAVRDQWQSSVAEGWTAATKMADSQAGRTAAADGDTVTEHGATASGSGSGWSQGHSATASGSGSGWSASGSGSAPPPPPQGHSATASGRGAWVATGWAWDGSATGWAWDSSAPVFKRKKWRGQGGAWKL